MTGKRINIAIALFTTIAGLCELAGKLYSGYGDLLPSQEAVSQTEWWLRVVRDSGIYLALFLAMARGVFLLVMRRFRPAMTYVLSSSLIFAVLFSLSLYGVAVMNELFSYRNTPDYMLKTAAEALTDETMPLNDRHLVTYNVARSQYQSGFELQNYVTPEGDIELYSPNAEDKALRQEFIHAFEILEWSRRGLKKAAVMCLLVLAGAVFMGAGVGWYHKAKKG